MAWLVAAACATHAPPPEFSPPRTGRTIASVPAHEQRTMQCGPAALASVLNHYGSPLTPDDIARDIYRPENLGTLNLDLALYPRPLGYDTRWYSGTLEDLIRAVDDGTPLIVMVDGGMAGMQANHFMVVSGYTPEGLVVLSGDDRPEFMDWTSFHSGWHKTNYWTLQIIPADTTPETTP